MSRAQYKNYKNINHSIIPEKYVIWRKNIEQHTAVFRAEKKRKRLCMNEAVWYRMENI